MFKGNLNEEDVEEDGGKENNTTIKDSFILIGLFFFIFFFEKDLCFLFLFHFFNLFFQYHCRSLVINVAESGEERGKNIIEKANVNTFRFTIN